MKLHEKTQLFMRRFKGRDDVYARKWYDKETGKGNYSPVCAKFWSAGCHIKLKDGKTCATCAIRETTPVSHDSVVKHITGLEEHSIYVIKENGMINFGAIDFDCKPDRDPKKSYYFDEVRKTSDVLDELGIKHAIARSTSDGFHIYMFFDEEYPSARFLAVVRSLVFERTGFAANNRQGIKLLPELFPKQTSPGGMGGLGNPIKPPMIEPRFQVERNCWVDKDNQMIPANQQWEYFSKIPDNTAKIFDDIIELYDLKVDDKTFIRTKQSSKIVLQGGGIYDTETGHWQPPDGGSMEKMIEGCAAFRRLREKMDKGQSPSHDEGFGLLHCGMQMQDGFKYFEDGKVPGWCATEKDRRQLLQSIEKGYKPWTCVKLQEKGVCIPGTKCFEKRPPRETIHGQELIRDDLPESEWPEPSPVRYGRGDGDDFLQKLLHEVDVVSTETDAEKRGGILKTIVSRAQVFDKNQQSILKQHIEKKKIIGKRDLGKLFNEAEKEKTAEVMKSAHDRSDTIFVNGTTYKKKQPYGYQVARTVKNGGVEYTDLCNFDVWIREVKTTIDEGDVKEVILKGVIAYDGIEKPFEIATNEFFDNSELFKKLGAIMDIRMTLLKSDLDDARAAWQNFSMREKFERITCFSTQGWYEEAYVMPSVLVDKLGVRSNTDKPLEIGKGDHTRYLGFKYLSDSEIREVLFHMKTDLFNAFPRGPLFIGIAHTLLASVVGPLGIKVKPTLWYEGLTGRGKSSMTKLLQQFYGNFPLIQNWTGTSKGMLDYCYKFKDAALVIDDYKAQDKNQVQAVETTIQYGYDGNQRAALNKNGGQRGDKGSRCLLICSGEDTPFGEASIISRMILVPYPKTDATETSNKYEKCIEMQESYCGVTPRFLHYFLNQDVQLIKKEMRAVAQDLIAPVREKINAPRVCDHFAMNYVVFKLLLSYMLEQGAIDETELKDLLTEHYNYTRYYRDLVLSRCAAEQQGVLFVDVLSQLIHSGRLTITGLDGYEHEHANAVGFIRSDDKDPRVYIYPSVAMSAVKKEAPYLNIRVSQRAIGEQLKAEGVITDSDSGEPTKMVVDPHKSTQSSDKVRVRTWIIDMAKLGFEPGKVKLAVERPPLDLPQPLVEGGLI